MRLLESLKNKILLITLALPWFSYAQDAAKAAAPAPAASEAASSSTYSYMLIAVATVMLIAIVGLSQVFLRLTMYVYENKKKIVQAVALILTMSISSVMMAQGDPAAAAASAAAAKEASSFNLPLEFWAGFSVILAELIVIFILLMRIWALLEEIYPAKQADASMQWHMPRWFDSFNASVAVEKETDIMLDHDYDGIKELDNALPPWWVYMFYATIIWGVCYFGYYHVFGMGPLSGEEYANAMETARIEKEAYMRTAKNNVDENTIKFDKSYVEEGKKIYTENCVACHGDKGQGGVGPNLTDDNWIHGGKINDVFKSVKYGWPANGMKSWQTDLGSMQIAQVVCFVKSLRGTNPPDPKAPQGDIYVEDGAAPLPGAAKTDSTAATASAAAKDSTSK